jgi:hypothetical protein
LGKKKKKLDRKSAEKGKRAKERIQTIDGREIDTKNDKKEKKTNATI